MVESWTLATSALLAGAAGAGVIAAGGGGGAGVDDEDVTAAGGGDEEDDEYTSATTEDALLEVDVDTDVAAPTLNTFPFPSLEAVVTDVELGLGTTASFWSGPATDPPGLA